MTILVWNVRGINDPLKQKSMVARIRQLKIQLVCLLETRVKENKSQQIIDRYFHGWNWINNYSSAYNGRIWLLWEDQIQVSQIDSTAQCITCSVTMEPSQFYLTVVYGYNEGTTRRRLWSKLSWLHGSLSQSPWMLAGDFNITADLSESSNFNGSQGLSNDMKEFKDVVQKVAVFDHPFTGPLFTWSNHQGEGFLARKLDRVLINDKWFFFFYSIYSRISSSRRF